MQLKVAESKYYDVIMWSHNDIFYPIFNRLAQVSILELIVEVVTRYD